MLYQNEPHCKNQKWGHSNFCLKRAERNLLCKSLPLGCVPIYYYIHNDIKHGQPLGYMKNTLSQIIKVAYPRTNIHVCGLPHQTI